MLSLSGIDSTYFTLYQDELYLLTNVTQDFTADIVITAVDTEDFSIRVAHKITVIAAGDWIAITAGVSCGIILIAMLGIMILVRHCSVRRYQFQEKYNSQKIAIISRTDEILKKPIEKPSISVEYQKSTPESDLGRRFGNVRRVKSKTRDSDSGRGESSSETQSASPLLGQWCQPECLTLGHSDNCWLPRGKTEFTVDVPPSTKPRTSSLSVWDQRSDSCYSSHNEAENGDKQHLTNKTATIIEKPAIV